jgi:hypothetical protein
MNSRGDYREALRALPELQPGEDAWPRIVARSRRPWRRELLIAGAAAGLALAVALRLSPQQPDSPVPPAGPAVAPALAATGEINALLDRSRRLEQLLRGSPRGPSVVNADTAGAVAELQLRLAAVDHRLNAAAEAQPEALWSERVDLLGRLVQVRYAEAQLTPL